jgi:hypothetical protein
VAVAVAQAIVVAALARTIRPEPASPVLSGPSVIAQRGIARRVIEALTVAATVRTPPLHADPTIPQHRLMHLPLKAPPSSASLTASTNRVRIVPIRMAPIAVRAARPTSARISVRISVLARIAPSAIVKASIVQVDLAVNIAPVINAPAAISAQARSASVNAAASTVRIPVRHVMPTAPHATLTAPVRNAAMRRPADVHPATRPVPPSVKADTVRESLIMAAAKAVRHGRAAAVRTPRSS